MSYAHSDNRIDAQHTDAYVGNVHRATLGLICAGALAIKLCHHAVYFNTLGNAMPVAAMCRRNPVRGFESGAHSGRASLLPGVVVDRADWNARFHEPFQSFFKLADQTHALVYPEQLFTRRN